MLDVFGSQERAVPGRELTGNDIFGLTSRLEITISGLNGTNPIAQKPDHMVCSPIEAKKASL